MLRNHVNNIYHIYPNYLDALTHCRLNRVNRLFHSIYWKSPIQFYVHPAMRFRYSLRKMAKPLQTVETLITCHILQQLIWVCTVCELHFYGSPKYNGFWDRIHSVGFLPFLTREATMLLFHGGSSVTVLLCASVVCFVIIYSSSHLLLVAWEGCAL